MIESEGRAAFCPECQVEYTFYPDTRASRANAAPETTRASDGKLARPCFACSFRTSRWDALWIPAFCLVIASFPLLWMVWSNIIGPFVFIAPVALKLWRRVQRKLRGPPLHVVADRS